MTDLKELQKKVIDFRDRRNWAQYHNPKDLAISLSLEAAELLEIFQWKDPDEVESLKSDEKAVQKVKESFESINANILGGVLNGRRYVVPKFIYKRL